MIETITKIKEIFELDYLLFLDLETFFAKDNKVARENAKGKITKVQYRLTKDNPLWKYAFDELFHFTGCSYAFDDGPVLAPTDKDHVPQFICDLKYNIRQRRENGERIGLVAHNATFDGGVTAWHAGMEFDAYLDTQALEKLFNAHESVALGATCLRYGLDAKTDELSMADGVPLYEFTDELYEHQRRYCVNDTTIMRDLLIAQYHRKPPVMEWHLINITTRAACIPQFVIDQSLLDEVLVDDKKEKEGKVIAAAQHCLSQNVNEVSPQTFGSNQKYTGLLQKLGLEVPQKRSPKTGKIAPALGKTDPGYVKLQIANPEHEAVYAAREAVKSTIASSRAKSMILAASLFTQNTAFDANMPMFLKYYGAENTGRWSGGENLNQQNLQRGSKHRLALQAQRKHVIAVNDLSQIELRMNMWFCGQSDILEEFKKDPDFDVYSDLASVIYNRTIVKSVDKDERQIGKAGSLGLGYAMSWYGFQQYLAGGPLGMDPMFVPDSFAQQVKFSYEQKNNMVVNMWTTIQAYVLPTLANGGEYKFGPDGCVTVTKDKIILPSGRVLHYPNTRIYQKPNTNRLSYVCDKNLGGKLFPRNIWHGLIIENIIQALSRDVLGFQMMLVEDQLDRNGYGWVIGSVHDEILAMIQETYADEGFSIMQQVMKKVPHWCQGIPLASEGGYAREYSK